LLGLLAFIRTAHYWTVLHPHLQLEDDAQGLLKVNEELTTRLLHDPEAARCDLGQRLFAEADQRDELRPSDDALLLHGKHDMLVRSPREHDVRLACIVGSCRIGV
jgi:hypothetical protein